jgi:TatA/E family protein of Tat protein translocase
MGMVGVQELLIIAVIAMIIFGPRQLPKLGRAMGETIKEFRGISKTLTDEVESIDAEVRETTRDVNKAIHTATKG